MKITGKGMISFGTNVVDSITGFEGIVTGYTIYMNGCIKYLVEGKRLPDGKDNADWVDEQRLTTKSTAKAGGPMPLAPKS